MGFCLGFVSMLLFEFRVSATLDVSLQVQDFHFIFYNIDAELVETVFYPFLFSLIFFLVLFFFNESASPSRDTKAFSTTSTPKSQVLASETIFFCYLVLFALIIFLVLFFFSESESPSPSRDSNVFFTHRRYYSASHFFSETQEGEKRIQTGKVRYF